MAFFKNILSGVLGDGIADALTSDAAKSIGKSVGKHAAEKAMETAAEKASEAAVNMAVDKAAKSLNRTSALETPPPPAVPEFQSLSVMVAVNGQSYGPYERATLLEMIEKGSLTRETFVFVKGMSDWKKASDVKEVCVLFGEDIPAPPAPPTPWANAPQAPAAPQESNNSLSPRLNQLIKAAVADGEISDLERQVLIRNAQQEGVAMDEFVMVLEACLYEQRRVLLAKEEEKKQRAEALQAQQAAAVAAAAAAQASTQAAHAPAKLTKCPHCGAPYQELSTRCPECGYDYPSSHSVSEAKSAWEKLADQLSAIDVNPNIKDDNMMLSVMLGNKNTKSFVKAKTITNFPIPVSKTDLFEFFTNCVPLAQRCSSWGGGGKTPADAAIAQAYYDKAKQVMVKARIVLKDDKEMLSQLEELAKQYKIK